jgi:hypothetical protein
MSYDPGTAARVRRSLAGRDDVLEKKMVGGLSFLVNGNMCCGVTGIADSAAARAFAAHGH